jgi:transcriptional regulator with XRE-family HTH domain
MPTRTEVGAELRAARAAKGLTQRQTADHVHRSIGAVSWWERGCFAPPPTVVPDLAALLGLDPACITVDRDR